MTRALRRMPGAAAAALLSLALATPAHAAPAPAHAATAHAAPTHAASSTAHAAPAHDARTPSPTPSATSPAKPAACPDVEFIGARGSGEDNGVPAKTRYTSANPTLGMGGPVSDVYKRISATAAANHVTITPYAVPYPAVGIDVISGDALVSGDLSAYSKSVELGAHAAAAELERVSRSCPDTGVVISGYSQGAQAMVEAVLSATPSARKSLVAAVFFGNTYFNSADTGDDFGSFAPGLDGYLVRTGASAPQSGVAAALKGAAPNPTTADDDHATGSADWADKFDGAPIFDYCHDGDPICGLVDERTVDGTRYPVRDFAHIVASTGDETGSPNILTHHTTYQRGDTANAAQRLRFALGLPLLEAAAPTAAVTAPVTAEVGSQTRLNAGGSLSDPADPIVSYRWTIDGGTDAQRQFTTTTPLTAATFFTTGPHRVSLRTTTVTGAHAVASAQVVALPAATTAPMPPTKITTTAGDGAAALSWPAVQGAEFYAVTDARGKLLTAFTPLVSAQQTVSWTDTGLANGHERSYRVYAVNSMGSSAASRTVSVTPEAADQHPAASLVHLPVPPTTLVDPELVWALGLGLMVIVLALALIMGGEGSNRPRRLRR